MQSKTLQFSLAWLLTVVTGACLAFAAVAWLGTGRIVWLGTWTLLVVLTTLPIYVLALSVVTLTTSGVALRRPRLVQAVLFLCCLPLGCFALLAIIPLLR